MSGSASINVDDDQEMTESTSNVIERPTSNNNNNKRTHAQIEVEDNCMSGDDDEDEVSDDEELDFFQRKRASLAYLNGSRKPASFNYTVLTPEKLQDHPIILRGCDMNTMWDMKELMQLRDNLRQLYDKSKRRVKIFKRDLKKIDFEMESKHYLPKSKKRKVNDSFGSGDEDDIFLDGQKMRVCGVVNSKGKPCQRTGFCPFHHKLTNGRKTYSFFRSGKIELLPDPAYDVNRSMLAADKKERNTSMKVSILLVAAAAIERKNIDEEQETKTTQQDQLAETVNEQSIQHSTSTVNSIPSIDNTTHQQQQQQYAAVQKQNYPLHQEQHIYDSRNGNNPMPWRTSEHAEWGARSSHNTTPSYISHGPPLTAHLPSAQSSREQENYGNMSRQTSYADYNTSHYQDNPQSYNASSSNTSSDSSTPPSNSYSTGGSDTARSSFQLPPLNNFMNPPPQYSSNGGSHSHSSPIPSLRQLGSSSLVLPPPLPDSVRHNHHNNEWPSKTY